MANLIKRHRLRDKLVEEDECMQKRHYVLPSTGSNSPTPEALQTTDKYNLEDETTKPAADIEVLTVENGSPEREIIHNFQSNATENHYNKDIEKVDKDRQQEVHGTGKGWSRQVVLEWIFVTVNLTLELPTAVFDQLSSVHKPQYALLAMLLSFTTLFICIVELIYKGQKEGVTWCWRARFPWFYYPSTQSHLPFGNFKDIIGLVFSLCQFIVTIISFVCYHLNHDNPIKVNVLGIIFALGLLCSRFLENPRK